MLSDFSFRKWDLSICCFRNRSRYSLPLFIFASYLLIEFLMYSSSSTLCLIIGVLARSFNLEAVLSLGEESTENALWIFRFKVLARSALGGAIDLLFEPIFLGGWGGSKVFYSFYFPAGVLNNLELGDLNIISFCQPWVILNFILTGSIYSYSFYKEAFLLRSLSADIIRFRLRTLADFSSLVVLAFSILS